MRLVSGSVRRLALAALCLLPAFGLPARAFAPQEGGEEGGRIVAQGTPEEVTAMEGSHTGRFLKRVLNLEEGTGGV